MLGAEVSAKKELRQRVLVYHSVPWESTKQTKLSVYQQKLRGNQHISWMISLLKTDFERKRQGEE